MKDVLRGSLWVITAPGREAKTFLVTRLVTRNANAFNVTYEAECLTGGAMTRVVFDSECPMEIGSSTGPEWARLTRIA